MKRIFILAVMGVLIPSPILAVSAEEIVERLEENTVFKTSRVEGSMVINDRIGRKESTFISYGRGVDDMLVEFREDSTHVLNAVSPGMTAALAFAEYIVDNMKK